MQAFTLPDLDSGAALRPGKSLNLDALEIPEGKVDSIHLANSLIDAGLLLPAGPETLRLLPPLNVGADDVAKALVLVKQALESQSGSALES